MKVYVVGDSGPEHNSVESIHTTWKGALRAWNKLRLFLLGQAKEFSKRYPKEEMWQRMVKNLSCKDVEKIDNYPHETPYIREYEAKE